MPLIPPTKQTLARYGLSMEEWEAMAAAQDHKCFICQKEPKKGKLCIDHYHQPKWKSLPADQRKLFVRCLLCWFCNHYYLSRGITIAKAKRVVECLEQFESRRPK